jgi:THAP4-like, heme-binding beta-barrel domain
VLEVPADLAPACAPIAWLLGRWEGVGVGDYPTIEAFQFGQELRFGYVPGKPFLTYVSRSWLVEDGAPGRPLARETGYWRPQPDGSVELLLSHPTGFAEVYLGSVEPARVGLTTRGVLRTETAKDYRSGHRMYGYVGGNLLWVFEMAAMGHELQPHLSAELRRVSGALAAREAAALDPAEPAMP